ncbi:MAG TPA: hypothetical protein VGD37_03825 [Kofleriaceae bacterium]|jgi:hypothetical protein
MRTPRWPSGTGQWNQLQITTVLVRSGGPDGAPAGTIEHLPPDTVVVTTLLDMIACLEDAQQTVRRVVLAGPLAGNVELAGALRDLYPTISVVHDPG